MVQSDWIKHVKATQTRLGLTYADALTEASKSWVKKKPAKKVIKRRRRVMKGGGPAIDYARSAANNYIKKGRDYVRNNKGKIVAGAATLGAIAGIVAASKAAVDYRNRNGLQRLLNHLAED
jgi:ElaB/YqjD/DUF883 family membrane-anchored ribosome-binding protein